MITDLNEIAKLLKLERKSIKKYFNNLKRLRPKRLDNVVAEKHEEVFQKMDCVTCANCCKTTSPIFSDKDISRIAGHLRMKPGKMVDEYLHVDEEGDYVLNQAPCTFLNSDNHCSIYDVRPKACREYPHTNRKNFYQLIDLTEKNLLVCPATYEIMKRVQQALP